MSAEDLERYETEIELQLYKEYRDVLPMFAYVVETERRFYLTNEVKLDVRNEQGQVYFELELQDAWVWDMYRPARFVANVRVVTFKDVNIEELARGDSERGRRSPARARRRRRGARSPRWYADGRATRSLDRNWRCREGELDLVVGARARAGVLRGEDASQHRVRCCPPRRSRSPKQRRLRTLALRWLAAHPEAAGAARCASTSRRCSRRGARAGDRRDRRPRSDELPSVVRPARTALTTRSAASMTIAGSSNSISWPLAPRRGAASPAAGRPGGPARRTTRRRVARRSRRGCRTTGRA